MGRGGPGVGVRGVAWLHESPVAVRGISSQSGLRSENMARQWCSTATGNASPSPPFVPLGGVNSQGGGGGGGLSESGFCDTVRPPRTPTTSPVCVRACRTWLARVCIGSRDGYNERLSARTRGGVARVNGRHIQHDTTLARTHVREAGAAWFLRRILASPVIARNEVKLTAYAKPPTLRAGCSYRLVATCRARYAIR